MNADHNNVVTVAVSPQRVTVERLTDIAVSFMNRDQIVIFCAEGIIVQMIGIIDEKEILSMELRMLISSIHKRTTKGNGNAQR